MQGYEGAPLPIIHVHPCVRGALRSANGNPYLACAVR